MEIIAELAGGAALHSNRNFASILFHGLQIDVYFKVLSFVFNGFMLVFLLN